MIYLFNSAFRGEYLINILNTLNLPKGMELTYRYSNKKDYCHVASELASNKIVENEDVLIIYIDRYHENKFYYIPLRRGQFIKKEIVEDKVYFEIQLLELYALEDKEMDRFNEAILEEFNCVPKLNKTGNPIDASSGLYAFKGKDISDCFKTVENPWTVNVERISKTKTFIDTPSIFTKTQITKNGGKPLSFKKINDKYSFEILKESSYIMSLAYSFNMSLKDANDFIEIEFVGGNDDFNMSIARHKIRNKQGNIKTHLSVRKAAETENKALSVRVTECNFIDTSSILVPSESISIFIKDRKLFWLEMGIYAILIGLCRVLVDPNFAEILRNYNFMISNSPSVMATSYILSALLTLLMFWRFGKKVM